MLNAKRFLLLMVLPALAAALIAGCGGGGPAGPPGPPSGTFTLTGKVVDLGTSTGIRGARVTIGTDTATTDGSGNFTVSMLSAPTATAYSIDLSSTTPAVYTYWATANGTAQTPTAITLPSGLGSGSSLGTITVVAITNPSNGQDNAPPPPIFKAVP